MQIDTIKIKDDGKRGFKIINKVDFDDKVHKAFEEPKPKTKKKVSDDDN